MQPGTALQIPRCYVQTLESLGMNIMDVFTARSGVHFVGMIFWSLVVPFQLYMLANRTFKAGSAIQQQYYTMDACETGTAEASKLGVHRDQMPNPIPVGNL
jgi:hypothetical protein